MKKNILSKFVFTALAFFAAALSVSAEGVPLPTNVGLPSGTLAGVIANFTNWILGIFGFLAIISFIVSGIMYFLAIGDEKAQEKAKNQMTWSIMGVVIGLIGLVVIRAVDAFLRASSGI
ncbi:MAG TPA: hypothetical protein VK254_04040 [Candidatus Bathyarchaeia archaeon]|nr:hypothetical protein [Candidatus Bathyarchaeia archaeon]